MTHPVDDAWQELLSVWDAPPGDTNKLPKEWRDWFATLERCVTAVGGAFDGVSYDDAELRGVERRLSAQIQGIHNGLLKARIAQYQPEPVGSGKTGVPGS
jgi:hypothetical protein